MMGAGALWIHPGFSLLLAGYVGNSMLHHKLKMEHAKIVHEALENIPGAGGPNGGDAQNKSPLGGQYL
jgi:hypothetical protein